MRRIVSRLASCRYVYISSANFQRRCGTTASTAVVQNLESVHQGGSIFLDATNTGNNTITATVRIRTVWQDHCEVHWHSEEQKKSGAVSVAREDDGFAHIIFNDSKQLQAEQDYKIDLRVPEIINIYVKGANMNLEMENKVQGDVSIETSGGSVILDKVRGENIDLDIGDATLNVKKVIEASALNVSCSKLDAKMINGDMIDVKCMGEIQVGAMYSKEARLVSGRGATIHGLHGNLKVDKIFL